MRAVKEYRLIRQWLLVATLLSAGATLPDPAYSQTGQIGKYLYEKLARTQQEYQATVASGDSLEVAEMCYRMGKRYSAFGDIETAQKWFIRSLRIREPLGPSEAIGKVYLRMAENQSILKHEKERLIYVRRALYNFQKAHSQKSMMGAYLLLAGFADLHRQERAGVTSFDSGLYYVRKAEQLAVLLKEQEDIGNMALVIGYNLADRNDISGAITYCQKAYATYQTIKSAYGMINASQKLADNYLSLTQFGQAKKWLNVAQFIRDTARFGDYLQNREQALIYEKLYEQTGDWEKALRYQKLYDSIQIATINADREGAISRLNVQYETQKKEARLRAQQNELALHQKNRTVERRLTFAITGLLVLAAGASAVFYWLFRKYKRISRYNAQLVHEQNHRVKNNLQSITNLLDLQFNRLTDPAARQAVEESMLRVEAMSLVHQRLYDGDRLAEIDLEHFIPELVGGVLRTYNLSHVRVDYTLAPIWLHADLAINLGLLLNELVTNSCKYAFPNHADPVLQLGCRETDGLVEVWYADNGPGFNLRLQRKSFGLKLINLVIERMKGLPEFRTDNSYFFKMTFNAQSTSVFY